MKKIISCLLILLSALFVKLTNDVLQGLDNNHSYAFLVQDHQQIQLLNVDAVADPNAFYQDLIRLRDEQQALLVRADETALYVEDVPVQKTYAMSIPTSMTLDALLCDEARTTCHVEMLMKENHVTVHPLQIQGLTSFYVIAEEGKTELFVRTLQQLHPTAVITATEMNEMFQEQSIGYLLLTKSMGNIGSIASLLLLLFLTIAYVASQNRKKISLRMLYGYHWLRICKEDMAPFGRILLLAAFLCVGGTVCYQMITGDTFAYLLWFGGVYAIFILLCFLILLVYSLVVWHYSARLNILASLRNEVRTKAAERFLCVLKVVVVPIVLLSLCPSLYYGKQSIQTIQNASAYHRLSEGYTMIDFNDTVDKSAINGYMSKVFDAFYADFGFYQIQKASFRVDTGIALFMDHGFEVNARYVNDQKLRQADGSTVHLRDDEDYVLLPKRTHTSTMVEDVIQQYHVSEDHILFLQENQPLFLFDYRDKKGEKGMHKDYALYVKAHNTSFINSLEVYIKADEKSLQQSLKQHDLQDDLRYQNLTAVSDRESERTVKHAWGYIITSLYTLLLIIFLLFSNLYFYFRLHVKKIFVKLLFGYSLQQVFLKVLLEEGVLLLVGMGLALLLNVLGVGTFYAQWLLYAMLILVSLDLLFFFLFLRYFRKASITQGLKGDQL